MKSFIVSIMIAALMLVAEATASLADGDVPNGIYVKGCADYMLVDNRVQQICSTESMPRRDFLSVTEFLRAFRGTGGGSLGGSDDRGSGE